MRRNSTARALALVSVGLVVAGGLGVGVSSTASASSVVSTPGVTTTPVGNYPRGAAVSPDNKWLYTTSSVMGKIWVLDVHSKKLVSTISAPGVADVAFSKTGAHAYALSDGFVRIIDAASRKITAKVADPIGADQIRLESGGRYLLMTRELGPEAAVFDTVTNKVAVLPESPTGDAAQFSATGATAYGLQYDSASTTTTFVRWNALTGAVLSRSATLSPRLSQNDLAVAADGSVAAVMEPLADGAPSDSDRTVDIIEPHSATVTRTVTIPWTGSFWHLDVSPDGAAVIVRLGSTLTVVDAATGRIRGTAALYAPGTYWTYSPDRRLLFVTDDGPAISGGSVDAIQLADGRLVEHVKVQKQPLFALPSATGKTLFVPNYYTGSVSSVSVTVGGFRPLLTQEWGSDRYGSSIVDSRTVTPQTNGTTFLTSDIDPALTLGVAAVAGADNGNTQFLVIPSSGASSAAITEIKRVKPERIDVVGDESIVSATAFAALQKVFGDKVRRLSGEDSTATLLAMEKSGDAETGQTLSTVYVADRDSYAAALAAPSAAAHNRAAYVLVDGSADSLPASVKQFVTPPPASSRAMKFVVMGSEKTISAGISDELSSIGTVTRISGADRYEIAQNLNHTSEIAPASTIAVNGDDVIGAAMSVAVGERQGGYLGGDVNLVHATCVPAAVAAEWRRGPVVELELLGSPSQLGAGVAAGTTCP